MFCGLSACDRIDKPSSAASAPSAASLSQPGAAAPSAQVQAGEEAQLRAPKAKDLVAHIETSKGSIYALLFADEAPQAVENFRLLAEAGYYDNSSFHRVVEDFLIQGGDPAGDGGQSAWGTPFPIEIRDELRHYTGALCMTATGPPPVCASQFYIVSTPSDTVPEDVQQSLLQAGLRQAVVDTYAAIGGAPYLDNTDTVFGQVYAGADVVRAICAGRLDAESKPAQPVEIYSITVQEYIPS